VEQSFFEYENKIPVLSIKGRRAISSYFRDVLNRGMKVGERVFSIEDVIKSEIKKIKKELMDLEDDEIEIKEEYEIEEEEEKEVAENELFTFV
jgi:hypothetical protein